MNAGYPPLHVFDLSDDEVSEDEKDSIAGMNNIVGAFVIACVLLAAAAVVGVLL